MPEPAVYVMEKMAHGYRRMGREAGAGFYDYADDGSTSLWSGLKAFERRSANIPEDDIRDRMIFIQVAEALRCLQEGVVGSPADADTASIALCGFPPTAGGVVQFIEKLGPAEFSERAGELASRYGERFLPPSNLMELIDRHGGPRGGSSGPASAG
jgi:3-hydroxyacyl-CoA dehydrogenase / enoyl-CoA hydratase / 3-hydroxybutyryl-CoA epimerase